jgi:MoaA/NifB/PqqE/SkfB family radical SAM enzyme
MHPDLSINDMTQFISNFHDNPRRLEKYIELLLMHEEAAPLATEDKQSLSEVNIVLTTRCNLRCVWCHREEDHYQDYLNREIDFDKVADLLPDFKGFSVVHWAGLGESLLYPRIFELTRLARNHVPSVKITTNGTTLTRATVDRLIDSGVTYLEVSIDGFDGKTNRKFRGIPEEKIIDSLLYLSKNSTIPIQINSVVSAENHKSLYNAIDRLRHIKNIVEIHTIPLFMTRHMQRLGIREIGSRAHAALLAHWRDKIDEYGLSIALRPDVTETRIDPVMAMKRRCNICFTSFEAPFINVDGWLTPCGRLQHTPLENVFEQGFDAAWNGPKAVKWRHNQLEGLYGEHCQRECRMKYTGPGPGKENK